MLWKFDEIKNFWYNINTKWKKKSYLVWAAVILLSFLPSPALNKRHQVSAYTWRCWRRSNSFRAKLTGYQVSKCAESLIGKDVRLTDLKVFQYYALAYEDVSLESWWVLRVLRIGKLKNINHRRHLDVKVSVINQLNNENSVKNCWTSKLRCDE